MAEPRFIHLRVHSDYSMIDGLAKTAPLVKRAAALAMPALAITDFTNLCGLVKFYGSARRRDQTDHRRGFSCAKRRAGRRAGSADGAGQQQRRLPEPDAADFPRLSAWLRGRRPDHRSRLAD
ncbi:PHP domain-containing protein [Serratia marcescens]|nr:PHP domain-containing protein [Serratia marcescens]